MTSPGWKFPLFWAAAAVTASVDTHSAAGNWCKKDRMAPRNQHTPHRTKARCAKCSAGAHAGLLSQPPREASTQRSKRVGERGRHTATMSRAWDCSKFRANHPCPGRVKLRIRNDPGSRPGQGLVGAHIGTAPALRPGQGLVGAQIGTVPALRPGQGLVEAHIGTVPAQGRDKGWSVERPRVKPGTSARGRCVGAPHSPSKTGVSVLVWAPAVALALGEARPQGPRLRRGRLS